MRIRAVLDVVLVVLLPAGAGSGFGCGTLTNLESPRTLAPGRWTVELEGRAIGTRSAVVNDDQTPHAISVHAGIRDGFELGARGGFARPELLAKWRLGGTGSGDLAVALSQSLGAWRFTSAVPQWQVYGRTALPIGIPIGPSDLIFTPKLHLAWGRADAGLWGVTAIPAVSAGWMWRGWRWVAIVPELTFGYSLLTVGTGGSVVGGGSVYEAGLGIIVGGVEGF
jgi:hypothetical protein